MKILQISHKLPYPPLDGGSIVINSLTEGLLAKNVDVQLLSMISPKRKISLSDIPEGYRKKVKLKIVEVDTTIRWVGAFINLFSLQSYHISRYITKKFEQELIHLLTKKNYDIIQFESIYVMPYFDICKKYSSAKLVLRTQNIEHLIWKKLTQNTTNIVKKTYLTLMTKRLQRFELQCFAKVKNIICITDYDRQVVQRMVPNHPHVTAIPFGLDISAFQSAVEKDVDTTAIFHLGSMDWYPNAEAMDWFLRDIWSAVFSERKDASFHLAGKFMPDKYQKFRRKNVHISGWIDDPISYMSDKQIMIVPLLSGSGIRVKIIEGMALGKTIISTTIGAQGIDCTHGQNILLADTASDFVSAILYVLDNPAIATEIGQSAKRFAVRKYDTQVITSQFLEFYAHLE